MEKIVFLTLTLFLVHESMVVVGQPQPASVPNPSCIRLVDLQELLRMPCRPSNNNVTFFAVDGWTNLLRNATTMGKQIFSAFMIPSNFTSPLASLRLPGVLPPPCSSAAEPAYSAPFKTENLATSVAYSCPNVAAQNTKPATIESAPEKPTCVRIIDLDDMLRMPCQFSNSGVSLLVVNGWNKIASGASSISNKMLQAFVVPAEMTVNALFDIRNLFSLGKQSLLQQLIKIPTALRTFATSTLGLLRQGFGNPICGQTAPPCQLPCQKIPEVKPVAPVYACPETQVNYPKIPPVKEKLPVPLYPEPAKPKEMVELNNLNMDLGGRMEELSNEEKKIESLDEKAEEVGIEEAKVELN